MSEEAGIKKIHLEHGYYFSPGYYRDFWMNKVENVFADEVKNKHVKFKPYREVWLGAILAAGHTLLTGDKHFVGLPPTEPPDVNLVKFIPHTMPSGRKGTKVEVLRVEITRCSLEDGEELIGQIRKKNTSAYEGMTLAVYLYGGEEVDMNTLNDEIKSMGKIHLNEIVIVGKVEAMLGQKLPEGTFAQVFLYPEVAQITFNVNDPTVFFREPSVLTVNTRGVSDKLTPKGTYRLLPPSISSKNTI